MAKNKERITARILYVEQGKTQKEVAKLVGVSEKTVSDWVKKFAWRAARNAKLTNTKSRVVNIKQIISGFAESRIELQRELSELISSNSNKDRQSEIREEMARIDSGVANWNKTLSQVDKKSRITLGTYIYVMETIFKALHSFDAKVFIKTIPFQEKHINDISIELG